MFDSPTANLLGVVFTAGIIWTYVTNVIAQYSKKSQLRKTLNGPTIMTIPILKSVKCTRCKLRCDATKQAVSEEMRNCKQWQACGLMRVPTKFLRDEPLVLGPEQEAIREAMESARQGARAMRERHHHAGPPAAILLPNHFNQNEYHPPKMETKLNLKFAEPLELQIKNGKSKPWPKAR